MNLRVKRNTGGTFNQKMRKYPGEHIKSEWLNTNPDLIIIKSMQSIEISELIATNWFNLYDCEEKLS